MTNAKLESSVGQLCSSHGVDPLNQLIVATKAAPGPWQRDFLLLSKDFMLILFDFKYILCFTSDCRLSEFFLSCSPSPDPMEQTEEGAPRATICALAPGRLQASTDSAQGSIKRVVHAGLELLNSAWQWKLHDDVHWSSLKFIAVHWWSLMFNIGAWHCTLFNLNCAVSCSVQEFLAQVCPLYLSILHSSSQLFSALLSSSQLYICFSELLQLILDSFLLRRLKCLQQIEAAASTGDIRLSLSAGCCLEDGLSWLSLVLLQLKITVESSN